MAGSSTLPNSNNFTFKISSDCHLAICCCKMILTKNNRQRTCDRCYKIKVRCYYESSSPACTRCTRLNHVCRAERKVLLPGRPSKTSHKPEETPFKIIVLESNLDPFTSSLRGFNSSEIQLVQNFLHESNFVKSFLYGPSFCEYTQSSLIQLLMSNSEAVKDAFIACGTALASNQLTPSNSIKNIERSSRALKRLHNAEPSTIEEVKSALFVAISLTSFHDLVIGQSTLAMTRSALLLAQPWKQDLFGSSLTDPNIISVMFAEISECLIRREIPIFRYQVPLFKFLDPYYGLCHELLPYFYDICVLGHAIKNGNNSVQENNIDQIYQNVDNWIAHIGDTNLKNDERSHVMVQAYCYKTVAELLICRLQSSSPATDQIAQSLAVQIRHEVEQPRPKSAQYLLFPYFVACLELENDKENIILEHMNRISNGIAPQSCRKMYEFLQYVWNIRTINSEVSWFDLVDKGPQFSIGP